LAPQGASRTAPAGPYGLSKNAGRSAAMQDRA